MARRVISGGITGLAVREKDDIGGAYVTNWLNMEPNSYADFGGEVVTVTRNPISRSRQRKKGAVVDFDASGGFNHDFTQFQLLRLVQAFFYSNAFEQPTNAPLNGTTVPITGVSATGYALDNDPALGFVAGNLMVAMNFNEPENKGLKAVTATTATHITAAGLVNEVPPANAKIQVVGHEFAAGDLTLTVDGDRVILGATAADLTTFGLHPGEWIFIGGDAAGNVYANNVPGYARISLDEDAITADAIKLDKTTWGPVTDAGAGKTMRVFFGTYIRNMTEAEIETDGDIVRHFFDIERTLGTDANGVQSQVLEDCAMNALTYNQPISDKPTVDITFVGLGEDWRDGTEGQIPGTHERALGEGAFNSSSCLYRARMNVLEAGTLNPTPMFAYVQAVELTIENNVSAVKVQGDIGGIDTIEDDFAFGGSATVFFQTVEAQQAIRDYSDVTFDTILAKSNAGYAFDIPLLGLGGGRPNVEKATPITVPLEKAAFENEGGYTASYVNWAYLPNAAMPAT